MESNNVFSRKVPRAIYRRSSQTLMVASMALFAALFIIVFRPFNIYRYVELDELKELIGREVPASEAFYIALVCVVLFAVGIVAISRFIMVHYNRRHGLTYLEYTIWSLLEFVILAIFITGFSATLFHIESLPSIFIKILLHTLCILLIPYGYCILYIIIVEKVQDLKELRESIENGEAAQQKSYVLFNDDKGLRLSVKRDNLLFIESADNYICVWYLNNDTVKKEMVRTTMKHISKQLSDSSIQRCHRSYIVNLDRVKVLRRDKEGIFIELGHEGVPDIPISRTYAESISQWLMK